MSVNVLIKLSLLFVTMIVIIDGPFMSGASLARIDNDGSSMPQPTLPTGPLVITTTDGSRHNFDVELAITRQQQLLGEMFRTSINDNQGMLFIWEEPIISTMWMKNTLVPLDMIFINSDNRVDSIAECTVPGSLAPHRSHGLVTATLEIKGGLTRALGIRVGDKIDSAALNKRNATTISQ